jgi:hypothetical protein
VTTTRWFCGFVIEIRRLLDGDAERVVEQRMVATHDLHADLLKVGHHGSNTNSTEELIEAVHPRVGSDFGGNAQYLRASAG